MKPRILLMLIVSLFAFGGMTLTVHAEDLSGKDKDFVKKAAMDGMMEVQLGQMAQEKAQAQEVKDFGARMVTDHSKANDELKALAQQKNVELPAALEHKEKSMMDKLGKKSGAAFDKAYMHHMVKDETKDVADFKKAAKKVKDPDIKAWAAKTLPTLEQHLEQAKMVAKKVGA